MLSAAQAQLAAAKLAQARAVPFAWLAGRNTSSVTRRRRPASPRRPLFVGSAGQVIAARGWPGEHMTLPRQEYRALAARSSSCLTTLIACRTRTCRVGKGLSENGVAQFPHCEQLGSSSIEFVVRDFTLCGSLSQFGEGRFLLHQLSMHPNPVID